MITSILDSTKKVLNLDYAYTAFDVDIITHINAVFSLLNQLGIGPDDGFYIEDASTTWDEFLVPANQLHMVKTYLYLKVRSMFDPPSTSFAIEAMNRQITEFEHRLHTFREVARYNLLNPTEVEVV